MECDRAVTPRGDGRVPVADHRIELLQLDDHLMSRQRRKSRGDRIDCAVKPRGRHLVKEIRMMGRHLFAQYGEIFLPSTQTRGIESPRILGGGWSSGENPRDVDASYERAHYQLRVGKNSEGWTAAAPFRLGRPGAGALAMALTAK